MLPTDASPTSYHSLEAYDRQSHKDATSSNSSRRKIARIRISGKLIAGRKGNDGFLKEQSITQKDSSDLLHIFLNF